jgi:hypothetical protein
LSEYHGIIINLSQKDPAILKDLDVIGKKKVFFNVLVLLKVRISSEDLDELIQRLQANLRTRLGWLFPNFYFHFYSDQELVAVFKNRIFRVTPDPSSWGEMIAYGRSLGIPAKQLDFYPCRFSDETY